MDDCKPERGCQRFNMLRWSSTKFMTLMGHMRVYRKLPCAVVVCISLALTFFTSLCDDPDACDGPDTCAGIELYNSYVPFQSCADKEKQVSISKSGLFAPPNTLLQTTRPESATRACWLRCTWHLGEVSGPCGSNSVCTPYI